MAKKPHEHGTHHPRETATESVKRATERDEEFPETASARETGDTMASTVKAPEETGSLMERAGESLTETAESVMSSVEEGAAEAREAAAGILPTLGHAIHQGVYSSFYYVTYGIVFSALVIGRWIPADNAMGEGVHDGTEAARKAFEERSRRTAEPAAEEEGLVTPA